MAVYITESDDILTHPLYGEKFEQTTVLIRAIMCENPTKVEYFLKRGCHPNSPVSKKKVLPLMVAAYVRARWKRHEIFKTLLEHGADPALCDADGRNCVMYACALSLKREVELLIKDCDYDINTADIYGDTVLHMCARAGNTDVLRVVLRHMLKYRQDINIQNKNFLTPLSVAILNGNYTCTKMLHNEGAYPRLPIPQAESSRHNSLVDGVSIREDEFPTKKPTYRAGVVASGSISAEDDDQNLVCKQSKVYVSRSSSYNRRK